MSGHLGMEAMEEAMGMTPGTIDQLINTISESLLIAV